MLTKTSTCNIHFDSGLRIRDTIWWATHSAWILKFQLNLFHNLIFLFQSPQGLTKAAVITAVKAGYRFIDCANDYDNEHTIGEALKELYAEGVVKRFIIYVLLSIILLTRSTNQFR